jgi:medium-chain acyl-[acyl-carrier-protein] hydrolase
MEEGPLKANPTGTLLKVWFPYWRPKSRAPLRLFCFPFAGGTASAFQRWAELGPSVEILAVQYPGRETRLHEPPCQSVPALVEELGPVMLPLLDRPFALFGYSLGTFLCLELARWLQRVGARVPLGLMLAAGVPPDQEREQSSHVLTDEELIARMKRIGGTPPEVLAHPKLMQLLLPMLRADFEMASRYSAPTDSPLPLPFAVWGGIQDDQPLPEELERWRKFTRGSFAIHLIPGGHFFLHHAGDELRQGLKRTLAEWSSVEAEE